MRRGNWMSLVGCAFAIGLLGCGSTERIQPLNQSVPLANPEPPINQEEIPALPRLTQLASVKAPELSPASVGKVQATNFVFNSPYAYVVYNTAGDEVRGALEIFKVSKQGKLSLVSSLVFDDAEFNDLRVVDDVAVLVGAESSEHEGAVIVSVNISDPKNPRELQRQALSSFVATSIDERDDKIFVTTGDKGDLYQIFMAEDGQFKIVDQRSLRDLNFIVVSDSLTYVLGGSPSWIWRGPNLDVYEQAEISRQGLESPARLKLIDNLVVSNAGETGLNIFRNIPSISPALDKVSSTELPGHGNGLDSYKDYLFLAQGDAGVLLYSIENPEKPRRLGSFDMSENGGSANAVAFHQFGENALVFIADGWGGFQVVKFEVLSEREDD